MLKIIYLLATMYLSMTSLVTCSRNTCPIMRYTGSFNLNNHVKDHALLGSSYKNLTTDTIQECFGTCVQDCRCVSYQLYDKRCELIDENRHTAPSDLFQPMVGYLFSELKQDFRNKASDCSGQCSNGCCRFSPCQNGGTCVELCDNVTRKFECQCATGYRGRACEIPVSCNAYSARSSARLYPIYSSKSTFYNAFCDMTSEPGMVWTLLESFALSNNAKYQYKPLSQDFSVNEGNFNWNDYRLSLSVMEHVKSHTTHWRATCRFDKDGFNKTDYVRGLLSDMDILKPRNYKAAGCFRVEYVNIRGKEYKNCTTHMRQDDVHIFIDSLVGKSFGCDAYFSAHDISENFGVYFNINKKHRCSSSPSSTTQWWMGSLVGGLRDL